MTTDVEPRGRRHLSDDATRGGLFTTLAANVAAIPGVTSVSGFDLWGTAPMELAGSGGRPARPIDGPLYAVLPRYFETMRVTLIVGRTLDEGTVGTASGEAVVNETFARRHWPGEQALGRQIRITRSPGRDEWLTVVGIVADVRRNPADLEREPHVYVSALRFPPRRLRLVARVDGPVMTASALERAARAADPDEPLGPPVTMDQQIAEWTAPSRFFATSLGGFAAVAMLIAVTGVFGVVSGAVAARTREFGIRLALGATPRQMVRLAVGRGARLAAVGAAAGLVVALGVSRVLVALPFGVERIDPAVVAGAAAAMIVVALAAAYTPARRAGRVEPTVALGHDA